MKRKKGKRYIFLAERREGKEGEKGKKKGGDTHLVSCKSLRYVRFFFKKKVNYPALTDRTSCMKRLE